MATVGGMRTPDEIIAMIDRLSGDIDQHGWDASVDAAYRALEWVMGATWPDLDHYMKRPDAARRAEWIARGGDPQHWPDAPTQDTPSNHG